MWDFALQHYPNSWPERIDCTLCALSWTWETSSAYSVSAKARKACVAVCHVWSCAFFCIRSWWVLGPSSLPLVHPHLIFLLLCASLHSRTTLQLRACIDQKAQPNVTNCGVYAMMIWMLAYWTSRCCTYRTDSFGETRLVPYVPSSSWKRIYYYCYYYAGRGISCAICSQGLGIWLAFRLLHKQSVRARVHTVMCSSASISWSRSATR